MIRFCLRVGSHPALLAWIRLQQGLHLGLWLLAEEIT